MSQWDIHLLIIYYRLSLVPEHIFDVDDMIAHELWDPERIVNAAPLRALNRNKGSVLVIAGNHGRSSLVQRHEIIVWSCALIGKESHKPFFLWYLRLLRLVVTTGCGSYRCGVRLFRFRGLLRWTCSYWKPPSARTQRVWLVFYEVSIHQSQSMCHSQLSLCTAWLESANLPMAG